MTTPDEVDFPLLQQLAEKPHPLFNVAEHPHQVPESWLGEALQETRAVHHLLDQAGIPHGKGDRSHVDARVYMLLRRAQDQADHLVQQLGVLVGTRQRIAEAHSKHVDEHGGTTGACNECTWNWPCPTYVWATTDRDVNACWDPRDDDASETKEAAA